MWLYDHVGQTSREIHMKITWTTRYITSETRKATKNAAIFDVDLIDLELNEIKNWKTNSHPPCYLLGNTTCFVLSVDIWPSGRGGLLGCAICCCCCAGCVATGWYGALACQSGYAICGPRWVPLLASILAGQFWLAPLDQYTPVTCWCIWPVRLLCTALFCGLGKTIDDVVWGIYPAALCGMWGIEELLVATTARGPFIAIAAVVGWPFIWVNVCLFVGQPLPIVLLAPFFLVVASNSNCCILRCWSLVRFSSEWWSCFFTVVVFTLCPFEDLHSRTVWVVVFVFLVLVLVETLVRLGSLGSLSLFLCSIFLQNSSRSLVCRFCISMRSFSCLNIKHTYRYRSGGPLRTRLVIYPHHNSVNTRNGFTGGGGGRIT